MTAKPSISKEPVNGMSDEFTYISEDELAESGYWLVGLAAESLWATEGKDPGGNQSPDAVALGLALTPKPGDEDPFELTVLISAENVSAIIQALVAGLRGVTIEPAPVDGADGNGQG